MTGFISQESIDEVTLKADIVSIIEEYVPLTQRGADWWGCCPFHNEKTPSFSVSPEKKFYYCFGCHAKGTVFNFVMNIEKLSYPESIEFLAKKTGVTLAYTESKGQKEDKDAKLKNEYKELYKRVSVTFHYLLMQTEAGKFALDYIKKRGITEETLERFKLGYTPADKFWLKKFLLKKNYTEDFLNNSGLFSKRYTDISFFIDRLMFPIFDRSGEVVAFGGRFLRGDSSKSPKYLNSGDLIHYKKGNILYAFNFAKASIREKKKVIFCEGYMDCIAYHQCGHTNAVAPLGTALTEEQVSLIKPFVEEVLLSFDSDGAGQNATKKAIFMCRKHGLTVKVIRLQGGKDPAEIMLNFGKKVLTDAVNNAILDNDYLLSRLIEIYPKNTPEGKAKASLEFFAYIDSLQSDVQKDACLDQLSRTYGIDQEAVKKDYINRDQLYKHISKNKSISQHNQQSVGQLRITAELRAVLTAITDSAELFEKMRESISVDDIEDSLAKKMFIIMEECYKSSSFSIGTILNRCDSQQERDIIIQSVQEFSQHTEQSVLDSICLIRLNSLKRKRSSLLERIASLQGSSLEEDKMQLRNVLAQKIDMDRQIASLKG